MSIEFTLEATGESGDSFVDEAVEWMNELDESDHEFDDAELEDEEETEEEPSEDEEGEEGEGEFDEEGEEEPDLDQEESEEEEQAESEYKANPNWQPEEKELFDSLSEEGKKAFLEVDSRREKVFAQVMQERAADREKYAALEQFKQQFEQNPAFKDHVVSFFKQGQPDQGKEPDMLEEVENNAAKKAIETMRQEENQRLLKQVAESTAKDPLRQQVIQGLSSNLAFIAEQEGMSLVDAAKALDSDPRMHLKWYQKMRSVIDNEQNKTKEKEPKEPKKTKPKAKKVKTFSKTGGPAPTGRKAKIKAARERAVGGDEYAIGDLIGAVFD